MPVSRWPVRLAVMVVASAIASACTAVHLVAPYNADLQQKASAMQAAVGTWDLTMRTAAGTVAADPRNPDVLAMLNKWHGEADAMLTLAISNDPGSVKCGAAVNAIHDSIVANLPADLRAAGTADAAGASQSTAATGCEAVLVSDIGPEIDEIANVLALGCKLDWVDDPYFAALTQNRATAPKPPAAPNAAQQRQVAGSCGFEFKPLRATPAQAAEAGHGPAVSRLLGTLQAIVYVENRKKAAP